MKFRFVLPILYAVVAVYLLFGPPGAAGHGPGGEVFFYVSFPLGLISILAENMFKSGELAVLSCFLAGVVQYALIGYLIDRMTKKRKKT